MTVRIKNCGLKTAEDIHAAAISGASFVGFVHHIASPRHLSFEDMATLAESVPDTLAQVVVLVDPSEDLLRDLQRHVRPHFLQLHGIKDPARIRAIGERTAIPVITALSIRGRDDLASAAAFETVSAHLLFDSPQSGSGKPFDWSLLAGLALKKSWFLAGGLTIENVADALRISGASMVDVSSGIERAPGVKSPELIAAFNKAVLNAAHA